ncbi:TRAP transporter substrate-binding protein DctP [Mailhella sp.]|uniref:TRAP transporter substrate-binding protein DctP n=1 Tax=Mailhella sp. TaxID=1981029 RepID=UPI004062E3C8
MVPCVSKALTLTYASNGPEQSVRGYAEKLFLDEIEIQTKGKIKVTAFWSNTLVSGNEILKAITDGVVDMGFINSNFYPKAMPFSNAITLNEFGPTTGANLVGVFQELYEKIPALREEYTRHKQIPVYFFATDCNAFASNRKLDDLSQLKGMKARASSRWKLADFKAMGATPVSVAWSECYMALQSGTVETILTSVESHHRGKLYEVAPYLWVWEKMWLGTPYVISMNEKKFKKLDKDLQEAIIRAGKIASEKFAKKFDADVKKEIADMEKAGTKVNYATDKDYDAWKNLPSIQGNAQTWLDEAKAAKLKDPEKVFGEIRAIVEKYLK